MLKSKVCSMRDFDSLNSVDQVYLKIKILQQAITTPVYIQK
jgi:hypothetical protein